MLTNSIALASFIELDGGGGGVLGLRSPTELVFPTEFVLYCND